MKKVRRTIRFTDDVFDEKYTFGEVSTALKSLQSGQSLSALCRANRTLEHPVPVPQPTTSGVRCPICKSVVPEVRRVTVCGRSVTLYPHPSSVTTGIGRVCRVEEKA